MAMIAFYAGLIIGVLLGFLLLSLARFIMPEGHGEELSTPMEGYPQETPLEP
ncbi:MAG: hypothetical protein ACOZFS_15500 [Thermodesulfobacteriota bacterium]